MRSPRALDLRFDGHLERQARRTTGVPPGAGRSVGGLATGMEDGDLPLAVRHAGEHGTAVRAAGREKGSLEDVNVGDHPVMDIAPEHNESRLVEDDRLAGSAPVQRQLELLGWREGVDVVTDVVLVGKAN